jgi:phage replication-related protein YjqB (UPF0714/DUF867 family)
MSMPSLNRRSVLAAIGAVAIPSVVTAGARPALAAGDTYPSNTALYADPALSEGVDYARRFQRLAAAEGSGAFPDTAIIALHGGGIEPGTSELCLAIAGYHPASRAVTGAPVYDYWMFEGIKASGNSKLHVTSVHCDDPVAVALVAGSRRTVSLHGCSPTEAGLSSTTAAVLVGGLDNGLRAKAVAAYQVAFANTDVQVLDAAGTPDLNGDEPGNIVNRNLRGAGLQLELTTPLRDRMFLTNTRKDRGSTVLQPFTAFVTATRAALAA